MHKAVLFGILSALVASSPSFGQGYQLEQYEPTPAGEAFVAVPFPWYSSTRAFAVGLTLDYGHNPLLGGTVSGGNFQGRPIVGDQLVGHLDLAGSLWDRIQVSGSLPITLLERGTPGFGVAPIAGVALGDPRLGVMVRAWRHAEKDPVSAHVGGTLWIPVGAAESHAGDVMPRGLLHAVLAGLVLNHVRWTFDAGVLLRGNASLNSMRNGPGTVGHALKVSAAAGYTDSEHRSHIGPELVFATQLANAFQPGHTSLEALLGAHHRLMDAFQVGGAVGFGLIRSAGTPDVRAVLRLAYAPRSEPAREEVPPEPPAEVAQAAPPPEAPAQEEPPPPPPQVAEATPEPEPIPSLPKVYFDINSDEPKATSRPALEEIATKLKARPELRATIEGHSDDLGPAAFNLDLSKRRAERVRRELVQQGIAKERLSTEAFGSARPLGAGSSRASQRRVEIQVTSP